MPIRFYILLAIRNLSKNKRFRSINVLSLALAFVSVFFIGAWVEQELSYDRHIPDHKHIYRLTLDVKTAEGYEAHFARVARDWVLQIGEAIPEIESTLRFALKRNTLVTIGEHRFSTSKLFAVDTTLFSLFKLPLIVGDPKTALSHPYSVILSESLASRYFGEEQPLGKYIEMVGQDDTTSSKYLITGIYPDFPVASHMHPEMLLSFRNPNAYGWSYFYLQLNPNTNLNDLQSKLDAYVLERTDRTDNENYTLHLQPITDIHLYSHKNREIELNGNIQSVYILAGSACLILLIALFNYVNMNIAQLFREIRFLIINKVYGASPASVYLYQLLKTALEVVLSLFLAVLLIYLVASLQQAGKLTGIPALEFTSAYLWICPALLFVFVLFVGSLPSFLFVLRRFYIRPSIRSNNLVRLFQPNKRFFLRRLLIGMQMTLSVVLIVASLFANIQLEFMMQEHMGMAEEERIVVSENLNHNVRERYPDLRNALIQSPYILDVTAMMEVPPSPIKDAMSFEADAPAEHAGQYIYVGPVAENYFSFFGRSVLAGNGFPDYIEGQQFESYILNEKAVRFLGYEHPEEAIGKDFSLQFFAEGFFFGGKIVGVVEDFHQTSLHHEITPTVYFQQPRFYINVLIKIVEDHEQEALVFIDRVWKAYLPEYPFVYSFQSQRYEEAYARERTQASLGSLFTLLAIVITLMGLVGITTILTDQRRRELAIRKVLGAELKSILLLPAREMLLVLLVATLVSVPVSLVLVERWMENFAYAIHPENHWWIFLMVALAAFALVGTVVMMIVYSTGKSNPVESLKWE